MKNNALAIEPQTETQAVLGVTAVTMKRILSQPKPADLIALYVFLAATAHRQETQSAYCTIPFAARGLGWSESTVKRVKKRLRELGLLETVARRDKSGRVTGWYILVRYLVGASRGSKNHPLVSRPPNASYRSPNAVYKNVEKKGAAPLLSDIEDFATRKGFPFSQAQKFFEYHQGCGWTFLRTGGCWKSKFKGWCDKGERLAKSGHHTDRPRKSMWDPQPPLRTGPGYRDIEPAPRT